jgi:hypothetical protein
MLHSRYDIKLVEIRQRDSLGEESGENLCVEVDAGTWRYEPITESVILDQLPTPGCERRRSKSSALASPGLMTSASWTVE